MRASAIRDITIRAKAEGVAETKAAAEGLGRAVDGAVRANDNMTRSTLSVDRALDRVRRQIDDAYRQTQRFEAGQRTLDKALAMNRISADEHDRAMAQLAQRYGAVARANDNVAKSTGLARHELINLGRQVQDIGVSLASGQSPFTVLVQQGAQVADIFSSSQGTVRGFFGQVTAGAAGFLTSAAGITTSIAMVGAAGAYAAYQYASGQREIETALAGTGRASGMTLGSINRVADSVEALGVISRSTARELASVFAATGRIDASLVPGLVGASRGYGQLTGQGDREAAQALAQSFASPSAGAAELEKRLGTLDDALAQYIRNAEASGNRTAAQKAMFEAFAPAIAEAASKTSLLARAWNMVANAVSGAADRIGEALAGQTSLEGRLDDARKRIRTQEDHYALTRDRSGLARAREEEAFLMEELRRRNTAQSNQARDSQASQLSRQAGDVLREIFGDEGRLQNLRNQRDLLEKTFGDSSAMAKLGPLGPRVSEGLDRLNTSLANFETAAQKAANDNALQIQSINAYTLSQKVAVEMERARIEAIRAGRTELQAGVEAEQARARVIAEANRQVRDTARDLKDAGSLIGLSPFQRTLQEARNQSRRESETLGTGAAASIPATAAAVRGLDTVFAENLRKLMAAVPGLSITSGFRTYDQQARLYAEKPGWAARPGTSNHERGIAADLAYKGSGQLPAWVRDRAAEFGIHFPLANRARNPEPWHAEPVGARARVANDNISTAANAATREANALRDAYEGWNTPLANAQRQLDANEALLKRQAETMFGSTEATAAAAEKQRLLNEYAAQGIPVTEALAGRIDQVAARYGEWARQQEDLQRLQETMRSFNDIGKDALKSFISDLRSGKSAAEAFSNVLDRIIDKLLDMAINALFDFGGKSGGGLLGSLGKLIFSANGNVFDGGGIQRFALGGAFTNSIVDRPTLFPFANGIGLMGEAGPEAIMPLRRGSDGRLGVSAPNYRLPPPAGVAGAAQIGIQINNNSSGKVGGQAKMERMPDGSTSVIIELADAVEAMIADRAAAGRSSLNDVFRRDANTMKG
jgi:phage-related minor tail protein